MVLMFTLTLTFASGGIRKNLKPGGMKKSFPGGTKFLFGNTIAEEILIRYCVAYFPIWYCTDYFQLTERLCELLKMHCEDFKDIWAQDYLLYKLAK
jgi:hypothetical protein